MLYPLHHIPDGSPPPAKDRRATMHRDTILKPATVAGLALLALAVLTGHPSVGSSALAQAAPPAQAPAVQARPQPAPAAAQPQAPRIPAAGTSGGRGAAQVGRSRRPSYAACNRISHARNLRGGARRRFLVRCKLGYDRPRAGQPQAAPARQP
ncbi:hypothetical protein [Methylobacterium sp. J-068]|uniref:hypothetical protein n=1 Tax=Methylobacterium sp. J-068 TaxID=2836649 RepID=UPI001FBB05C0|nr:hypothetical protein [Methylobacterium sp. J-068]MCJ2033602.1 hypothetical protein [Methylobacterium sp. J-068]